MASGKNKKNNKKASKKKKASSSSTTTTPYDAQASLLRMEKVYEDLLQNEAKRIHFDDDDDDHHKIMTSTLGEELVAAEYVVAARCPPAIADWIPVAQVVLARPLGEAQASEGSADVLVQAAVSRYCREIAHVAGQESRVFQSLARNDLEYAVESIESFYKYVYEAVVQGKQQQQRQQDDNEQVMTKVEARRVLQLDGNQEEGETVSAASSSSPMPLNMAMVKRQYRKLSMTCHPDRLIGQSDEAKATAAAEYAQIKLAYETLQSGVRDDKNSSWYASLGGRARTDFRRVTHLLSVDEATEILETRQAKAAVGGMEPEFVQTFVARVQSASAAAATTR